MTSRRAWFILCISKLSEKSTIFKFITNKKKKRSEFAERLNSIEMKNQIKEPWTCVESIRFCVSFWITIETFQMIFVFIAQLLFLVAIISMFERKRVLLFASFFLSRFIEWLKNDCCTSEE